MVLATGKETELKTSLYWQLVRCQTCTAHSEPLLYSDKHFPLALRLNKTVIFPQHCSSPLPIRHRHSFQTREVIPLKNNPEERKQVLGGTGFSKITYPPSLLNLYTHKNEDTVQRWQQTTHGGQRPWGTLLFPVLGHSQACFSFCLPDCGVICRGTCFSSLTVRGVLYQL